MAVRLGEMLVKAGLITPEQLQEALAVQHKNGGKLGYNLIRLGYVREDDITQLLSEQYGVPSINLRHFEIDETVISLVPSEVAQKYMVLPVNRTGATLTIAMADPTNVFAMDDIKFMTGYNVEPVVASEVAIREAIEKYYGSQHALELKKVMDEMAEAGGRSPRGPGRGRGARPRVARGGDRGSAGRQARQHHPHRLDQEERSDIHIEPYEKDFRVRFRIDGVLYEIMHPPMKLQGRDHEPHQDHGQARHLREAPAPGRPHQDQDEAAGQDRRRWTTASRSCPRCSARRSSCACWTRTT